MQRTVLVAAFAATFLVACPAPTPQCIGTCTLDPAAMSNADFSSPFDATLSPDGKIAYFTALTPNGPGIFATTIGSSDAPKLLAGGDLTTSPLASPLALDVTSDGSTLYVADSAAVGLGNPNLDLGLLFTVDTTSGTIASVDATAGYSPRGLVVVTQGADQVYFSGNDPADGMPGVFKITAGGSTVTAVAKGAPFIDPSGLVVAKNGDVFVADTSDSSQTAVVYQISNGAVTPLLTGLRVGYPAGISITTDQSILMISALDKDTAHDVAIKYTLKDGTIENFTSGIDQFEESAGLHRAKNVESYVWADSLANNGGTVYVINKIQ
jgi:hypothetical protein